LPLRLGKAKARAVVSRKLGSAPLCELGVASLPKMVQASTALLALYGMAIVMPVPGGAAAGGASGNLTHVRLGGKQIVRL
jgi:hypothetical protein